jgi:hypothetical protein
MEPAGNAGQFQDHEVQARGRHLKSVIVDIVGIIDPAQERRIQLEGIGPFLLVIRLRLLAFRPRTEVPNVQDIPDGLILMRALDDQIIDPFQNGERGDGNGLAVGGIVRLPKLLLIGPEDPER